MLIYLLSLCLVAVFSLTAAFAVFEGKKPVEAALSADVGELYAGNRDAGGKVFDKGELQKLFALLSGTENAELSDLNTMATRQGWVAQGSMERKLTYSGNWFTGYSYSETGEWRAFEDTDSGIADGYNVKSPTLGTGAQTWILGDNPTTSEKGALVRANSVKAGGFASPNIIITLGGLKWYPVFLTTQNNGTTASDSNHIILTLWSAETDYTSTWGGNSNEYANSTVRNYLNTAEVWKKFTENTTGANNDLYNYIVAPKDVAYQQNQKLLSTPVNVNDAMLGSADSGANNYVYAQTETGKWRADMQEYPNTASNGAAWASDKLWLPSYNEAGVRARYTYTRGVAEDWSGIIGGEAHAYNSSVVQYVGDLYPGTVWGANETQGTAHYSMSTGDIVWLRTGGMDATNTNTALAYATAIGSDGKHVETNGYEGAAVSEEGIVRPALHLDLTAAWAAAALTRSFDEVLDQEALSEAGLTAVPGENGIYEYVYDGKTPSIKLKDGRVFTASNENVGDYSFSVDPTEGYIWKDYNPILPGGAVREGDLVIRIRKRRINAYVSGVAPYQDEFIPASSQVMFLDADGVLAPSQISAMLVNVNYTFEWCEVGHENDNEWVNTTTGFGPESLLSAKISLTVADPDVPSTANNFEVVHTISSVTVGDVQVYAPTIQSLSYNGAAQILGNRSLNELIALFNEAEPTFTGVKDYGETWQTLIQQIKPYDHGENGPNYTDVNVGTTTSYYVRISLKAGYKWNTSATMNARIEVEKIGDAMLETLILGYSIIPRQVTVNVKSDPVIFNNSNLFDAITYDFADTGNLNNTQWGGANSMAETMRFNAAFDGGIAPGTTVTNAGEYTLNNFIPLDQNFTVTIGENRTFTVAKRSITAVSSGNPAYTGSTQRATITFEDVAGTLNNVTELIGSNFSATYSLGGNTQDPINAGAYSVSVALFGASAVNFELESESAGTYEITQAINEWLIGYSRDNYDRKHHEATPEILPVAKFGSVEAITYEVKDGDTWKEYTTVFNRETPVGTYRALYSIEATANYTALSGTFEFNVSEPEHTYNGGYIVGTTMDGEGNTVPNAKNHFILCSVEGCDAMLEENCSPITDGNNPQWFYEDGTLTHWNECASCYQKLNIADLSWRIDTSNPNSNKSGFVPDGSFTGDIRLDNNAPLHNHEGWYWEAIHLNDDINEIVIGYKATLYLICAEDDCGLTKTEEIIAVAKTSSTGCATAGSITYTATSATLVEVNGQLQYVSTNFSVGNQFTGHKWIVDFTKTNWTKLSDGSYNVNVSVFCTNDGCYSTRIVNLTTSDIAETVPATCLENGNNRYSVILTIEDIQSAGNPTEDTNKDHFAIIGEGDSDTMRTLMFDESIPALGHNYELEWSWEGFVATATFTCKNDAAHKETPAVSIDNEVTTPA
ncbi:MAG: hypothetical protein IKD43_04835, partial [Clostridia bacterium]|nr:hypothetical protein [Clostridia bacterium]